MTPPVLVPVEEAAKAVSCKAAELFQAIEDNQWSESQGVYHFLPGKHGIRIDLYVFLNWRRYPISVLADARLMEAAKTLLAVLMPGQTVVKHYVDALQGLYESAARRIEEAQEEAQQTIEDAEEV
jgi:hypothetical protein